MDIPTYKPKEPRAPREPKPDTPPKGRPSLSRGTRLAADRTFKFTIKQIRDSLQNALAMTVLALSTKAALQGDEVAEKDADLLTEYGEELIDKWCWLAEKNPQVRRALELLCGGGGYFSFAMVNIAVILGLAQNHGMYPEEWPTPSSLKMLMGNMFGSSENGYSTGDESSTDTDS